MTMTIIITTTTIKTSYRYTCLPYPGVVKLWRKKIRKKIMDGRGWLLTLMI